MRLSAAQRRVLEALDCNKPATAIIVREAAELLALGYVELDWDYSGYSSLRQPFPRITAQGRHALAEQEDDDGG